MQDFDGLAAAPKIVITEYLSTRDLVNLAQISKAHSKLFAPMIDVRKLLHHATRGEHDKVEAMLKKDMSLMFKRGNVTDCSGRTFNNISAFEYALWALDKNMWAVMIGCIPSNEEGRKVFEKLRAQYNKVNTDGVTYRLNGKTITENHFDFKNTIIKELQTQLDSRNAPGDNNWDAIDKQWREGVGGAQKLLPMHIVYEYCSNEPFYPVPMFTSQPKSSKKIYNLTTEQDEDWFNVDSKLGIEFAVHKGCFEYASGWQVTGCADEGVWRHCSPRVVAEYDLNVMKALCKVRTYDFIDLRSQLEEQMKLDNHHQVVPI
ncbi:TPA: F-box protein [Legionella pneumophila]|nr:hypothetical protein [Legionella pneumophila]HAT8866641.1 F-box protein [Legionella pneumophila subsp. pneumophila]HAT7071458.1 F-box protein [Legionella pneumophila]HAT8640541.1 F-box protein [Legionella pneumophila]HAT8888416.1 F-box protein [Legionella pneumophila subsp. pneumophila]HAT8933025.1 F-box protein [Legionella pneumophila subsp. pneumophila]